MDHRIALDIIAIASALYSTAVWFANNQIKVDLESKINLMAVKQEAKIDKMMLTISDRIRRQSDANKANIGIIKGELNAVKAILNGAKNKEACIEYDVDEILPEETGFG